MMGNHQAYGRKDIMIIRIFLLALYNSPNMFGFEFFSIETLKIKRSLLSVCEFEKIWVVNILFIEVQFGGSDF